MCVVKGGLRSDVEKTYQWGLEHGYGSREAREEVARFLEVCTQEKAHQSEDAMVDLSNNSRLVQAEGVGRTHMLTLTEPGFNAEQIPWVLGLE